MLDLVLTWTARVELGSLQRRLWVAEQAGGDSDRE